MATLQGKAVKNTYRQVLQIGANNVGVSGTAQRVQDGAGVNTALSLSTIAATIHGDLTITGDLIITGGGIQIQDLIDDTVATLIQNGTGITWAYNDGARTLTPTITIATADGGVQGDFLQLNTGANEASAVGKLKWNTTDGTMDIGLMGGNVILQVGQEQVARVLNNSGTNFTEAGYQAVKITSAQGQRLAVGLAQANNEANSKDTLGLVTENISNNQEGFITTSGLVRQIDTTGDIQTEVWVDGDTLYLSPSVPGRITKVKPTAPNQTVIMGFVVYAHKNNGKIFVKVDNGYELDELHDVKITSVANNNILKYNSSLSVWENVAGTTTNISEGTNLYYTQARFDSAFAAKTTTNLTEGANLYYTTARGDANFATNFATKTTTNLPEGSNLYYTNTRARTALSITAGTGIDYNNTTGVFALSAIPNASLTNSSVTINSLVVALGSSITLTTTNIAEGTNLYWTDARFDTRFSTKTTTNLTEGTNLYYTQARFNTAFTAKSTTDLAEGTNLYYTDARSRAAISESAVGLDYSSGSGVLSLTAGYAIPTTVKLGQYDTAYNRSIVSAAVSGTTTKTLTLTEQDANTITATWTDLGITTINGTANQIAANTVGNTTTIGFTNDVTMPNNLVVSGNLTINGTATYVNTQSISAKDPLFEVANDNNTTDVVDIGYYGRFYDSAQTRVEFTGLFRDASDAGKFKFFTGLVDEPTNVVNTSGVGYTVGTLVANFEGTLAGTASAANILSTARTIAASGDATWSVSFDGSANATAALTLANTGVTASTYGTTTAVPTIAIDGKGRITSASNTNIAFPVTTVNGASGTVVLTTSNIAEGTNQYFTSARAQAAISGTAPISVASGVVSISQSGTATDGFLNSTDWNTFNGKSPAAGSTSITTLGTITTGVWNGTAIAIANGGTGSTTQNFVDLTTTQTIAGAKTFSGITTISNATASTTTSTGALVVTGGLGIGGALFGTTASFSSTLGVTGALSGTSATFSGNVGIGGATISSMSAVSGIELVQGSQIASRILASVPQLYISSNVAGDSYAPTYKVNGYATQYRLQGYDGTHVFYTAPSGTAGNAITFTASLSIASTGAATFASSITAAGNITTSKSQASTTDLSVTNTNTSNGAAAQISAINGGASQIDMVAFGSGSTGTLYGITKANLKVIRDNSLTAQSNGLAIGTDAAVPFYVFTNSVERMRITSAGDVQFGTGTGNLIYNPSATAPALQLSGGSGTNSVGSAAYFTLKDVTNTKFWLWQIDGSYNYATWYNSGGSWTKVGYQTTGGTWTNSDERRKENIVLSEYGLKEVLQLIPKKFNFIIDERKIVNLGFIAQDVLPIIPEAVQSDMDGEKEYYAMNYQNLVPVLVKGIQEQQAQIEELRAMIAAK